MHKNTARKSGLMVQGELSERNFFDSLDHRQSEDVGSIVYVELDW
jgi:hypothetical protein